MKRTHSTKQLFHLFCNMTNSDLEGFKTSSKNAFFEDGVLWSYGRHYPMAAKYGVGSGLDYTEFMLINSAKSSVTTEKHKFQLSRSAKDSQLVLMVPDIRTPTNPDNEISLMNEVVSCIDNILNSRVFGSPHDLVNLNATINQYNKFCLGFGLITKEFSLPSDLMEAISDSFNQKLDKANERETNRQLKRNRELRAKQDEYKSQVALWYQNENTKLIPVEYFGLDYDVIRVNGDIVQTNRGAEVPLKDARSLCAAILNSKNILGTSVGEFTVVAVDSEFIKIGCHKINISQAINAINVAKHI